MITSIDNIVAVLWDVDGTLIDTTALIVNVLDGMFHKFAGVSTPYDEIRALIGIPLEKQVYYLGDPSAYGADPAAMIEYAVAAYEMLRDQECVIVDVVDILIRLKRQGLATALVTSKNDVELTNTLPRLGISAYCDAIVGADQAAPFFKPHPRPIEIAMEQLGVTRPEQVIFIGDSIYDIRAGKGAGVRTGAVLWGAATEAALVVEQPDYIFSKPADILAVLSNDHQAQSVCL